MVREYLQQVFNTSKRGDAREESFYPHLKELIETFASSRGKRSVHVTTLPKKTDAGNPSLRTLSVIADVEADRKSLWTFAD